MDFIWGITSGIDPVSVGCALGAFLIVLGLIHFDRPPAPVTHHVTPEAPQAAPGTVVHTYEDGSREIAGLHRNFTISADGRTVTPLD